MWPRPLTDLWRRPFVRFVAVGGVAASVNIAARIWFNLAMSFTWAIVLAYLCGMTTAWILTRLFVFQSSGMHWTTEYGRFALVNVVAAFQVWAVSEALDRWLFPAIGFGFHPRTTAHVIGVLVPVLTSYLGHKHFSFAPRRHPAATPPVRPSLRDRDDVPASSRD